MHMLLENSFVNRVLYKSAFALAMAACLFAAAVKSLAAAHAPAMDHGKPAVEWPNAWDGVALRPVALGDVEQRFADRFPGAIVRMTGGGGAMQLVFRQVDAPTRMLHPADDCYRGLGYSIQAQQLERDTQQRLWRCFDAVRPGAAGQRVCERIEDAAGRAFTDTSSWYWAAVTAGSHGPWTAITVARPL